MSAIAAADPPRIDPELASLVERTRGLQPWRRVFHATNGLMLAFLPPRLGLGGASVAWILFGIMGALLLLDLARLRVSRLNTLFFKAFPALASPREAAGLASSTWYAAGTGLVFALFPGRFVVPAILVLALADPTAAVVGRTWGRRRLGKGSVLGSTAFLAVSLTIFACFVAPATALAAAVLVTSVEIIPWRLDDNLTVPIAAAGALWLMGA